IGEGRIQSAGAAGARGRAGGARRGQGLQFSPTVLSDCRQDMDVMRKEIFGPVMPIMKVRDEEEAVALANDSHLGLAAYVFTDDKRKGQRLAEKIESGTTRGNDVLITLGAPPTPWAGGKQAGVGITHPDP